MSTRINVMFPDDLLQQLRDLIPERKRSDFIVGATRDFVRRERQRRALELTAGAWRDESNPNAHTQEAAEETIREMRSADSEREACLEALR
jgi:metal-responsive CopG/Arc/MetJ family transcriptional regulator